MGYVVQCGLTLPSFETASWAITSIWSVEGAGLNLLAAVKKREYS
jgi:hypothetical protein